jgi:hypothetical protein
MNLPNMIATHGQRFAFRSPLEGNAIFAGVKDALQKASVVARPQTLACATVRGALTGGNQRDRAVAAVVNPCLNSVLHQGQTFRAEAYYTPRRGKTMNGLLG